jgi:Tol biopolymer transport system component
VTHLASGSRLGPYEIVERIGAGGMGEVYRATDHRLRREVAVKVLPTAFLDDPERLRRFRIESLAAAALNHPTILTVYDVGSQDGAPFVVSELLDGISLYDRLTRGPLPLSRVIDYGVQIATGLAIAHEKGIVHRDLKPDNLFITADDRVKILDFGVAKLTERTPDAGETTTIAVTEAGTLLGTAGYMSPEQIRGRPIDHRADIFSLGCVIYEMASGRRAFQRDTTADCLAAALKEDVPALPSTLPEVLQRITSRCLEKAPERRFQSAADLAFALATVAAAHQRDRTPATTPPAHEAPTIHSTIALPDGIRLVGQSSPVIAITKDGTKVAYVAARGHGPPQLWVARLDRGETLQIPESDAAAGPCFSPDGQWIAFAAGVVSGVSPGELRKYSFASGLTQTVCPLHDFEGACWADDGAIYFVGSVFEGLRRVQPGGGGDELVRETFRVRGTDTPRCIGFPTILSRERAFVLDWDASPLGDTSLLDLSNGTLRSIASSGSRGCLARTGHVLFTKTDGTLLAAPIKPVTGELLGPPTAVVKNVALDTAGGAFAVSDTGTLVFARGQLPGSVFEEKQLLRLSNDGTREPLAFPPDAIVSAPDLSPDRQRMAVASRIHGLWIYDLVRGTRMRLPPGASRLVRFPVWTPDGERVVFRGALVDEMGFNVFVQSADGRSGPEILNGLTGRERRPRAITPDGAWVLCEMSGREHERGLWAFATSGTSAPRRLVDVAVEGSALSPDGRVLAYQCSEFGAVEIFVRRLDDRGVGVQASLGGGRHPLWSPDGEALHYFSNDQAMTISVDATRDLRLGKPVTRFEEAGVECCCLDGDAIIAVMRPAASADIRQLQLVTGWFSELTRLVPQPASDAGS